MPPPCACSLPKDRGTRAPPCTRHLLLNGGRANGCTYPGRRANQAGCARKWEGDGYHPLTPPLVRNGRTHERWGRAERRAWRRANRVGGRVLRAIPEETRQPPLVCAGVTHKRGARREWKGTSPLPPTPRLHAKGCGAPQVTRKPGGVNPEDRSPPGPQLCAGVTREWETTWTQERRPLYAPRGQANRGAHPNRNGRAWMEHGGGRGGTWNGAHIPLY
ncbi:hypothetical protein BJY52DRAFT_1222937 [Lactarius psammicola]|nr:hypothetical protein BJY52DRAFT_1222937 [Lactarius psammicola]